MVWLNLPGTTIVFFPFFWVTRVSSQLSTDANGVDDSAMDYKCLFSFSFFVDTHVTSQLSTDASGVADSARHYKRLFVVFCLFVTPM